MIYFEPAFLDFFKSLAPNNHKDWFDAHRKEYENHVKKPFERFVADLISNMSQINENLKGLRPGDCIFRINRDIRFSQDKTPYKLQMSAIVAEKGRKTSTHPGIYIELTPEHAGIYSGYYMPEKDQLLRIRNLIAANQDEFNSLINDPVFNSFFKDGIQGEKNKALPADLKSAAGKQPLIYNKQFYWNHYLAPEEIFKPDFLNKVMDHYKASMPLLSFLDKAVNPSS